MNTSVKEKPLQNYTSPTWMLPFEFLFGTPRPQEMFKGKTIDVTINSPTDVLNIPRKSLSKKSHPKVHYGQDIQVEGCTKDYAWCKIAFTSVAQKNHLSRGVSNKNKKNHGWVPSSTLTIWREGAPYSFEEAKNWFHCPVIDAVAVIN